MTAPCNSQDFRSVYSSTQATTSGSDTPSASEIMSTTPTPTANLQISSPAYENMFRTFQDTFVGLRADIARLEIENKRLVEHNTVIEKELETLNEHNTIIEKELATLNEENVKLSDAMKKLAEVEEEKAGLQKELGGLEGLKEVLGWKKRCEELENRATENQERMEKLLEDYQQKTEKQIAELQQVHLQQGQQNIKQAIGQMKSHQALQIQITVLQQQSQQNLEQANIDWKKRYEQLEHLPRTRKEWRSCLKLPAKMEKRVAEVQQGQQNLEQAIDRIKAHHALEMQDLVIATGFMGLEDWKDGYIFREKPLKIIPNGTIQKFINNTMETKKQVINKWEKEASQKDRVYIKSGVKGYEANKKIQESRGEKEEIERELERARERGEKS
ncbi:hypothetical protein FPQ18DRAFT_387056 [Pyronema domesticum]|nr:hypothetical protein FPQ18DRAFT_387056 [Pyronema domesticum]